jgi:hypothetical protein
MTVRQDMTLADLGQYYYYPALRPDVDGNLQMVFNASSASDFAGLRTSGQRVSDPLNTLGGAAPLRAGAGAQTTSSGRMGDYSGAAVDPADPHTVWVNGEYIRSMGPRNWGTLVAALAFPSPLPSVSLALSKPAAAPGRGLAFTGGDTLQVDLTVANPGSAVAVDVYFGMVLPPAAGFSLGCLNGDPVAFFTNSLATTVVTCLSSPPQSFPALFQGATIPAGVAPTTLVNFWSFVWPATAPVGPYTVFVALTVPGALADGVLAPGDLIAVSTADASFLP